MKKIRMHDGQDIKLARVDNDFIVPKGLILNSKGLALVITVNTCFEVSKQPVLQPLRSVEAFWVNIRHW